MKGIKFKGSRRMGAAPGMENCLDLPVKDQLYDNKYRGYESRWELTDEELERIQQSRTVILDIVSPIHPPVMLSVATERSEPEGEGAIPAEASVGYTESTCAPVEWNPNQVVIKPPVTGIHPCG